MIQTLLVSPFPKNPIARVTGGIIQQFIAHDIA